jgi:hypothetical protein
LYYDSLQALNIQEQARMPDTDIDDVDTGSHASEIPSTASLPSGVQNTTKNVPPSVARHDNVIKSQNH